MLEGARPGGMSLVARAGGTVPGWVSLVATAGQDGVMLMGAWLGGVVGAGWDRAMSVVVVGLG